MTRTDIDGHFFFDSDRMPAAPRVVEVGAYSAHAAAPLLGRYPECRFAAVEASRDGFDRLKAALAPFPGAVVLRCALAGADGEVAFNEYEGGLDASSVFDRKAEGLVPARTTKVEGLSLGSLLDRVGFPAVDLLLLNCEGAELFALRQLVADAGLRARVGQVCVSFHCEHVRIYSREVRDELLAWLYPCYDEWKGGDSLGYWLLVEKWNGAWWLPRQGGAR